MIDQNKNAPSAASTVLAEVAANGMNLDCCSRCKLCNRQIIDAIKEDGSAFKAVGKAAIVLRALTMAGDRGLWANHAKLPPHQFLRGCSSLRRNHGLKIDALWEAHEGTKRRRCVLRSTVKIIEFKPD